MASGWRHPGRTGAIVYAVLAAVVGSVIGVFSRLQVAKQRSRSKAAEALPSGAIIVISNHTSYADGVLLALACRRLGRELRLLATAGVFKVPVIGSLARTLGFIRVQRGSSEASAALDEAATALGCRRGRRPVPGGSAHPRPDDVARAGQDRRGAARVAVGRSDRARSRCWVHTRWSVDGSSW